MSLYESQWVNRLTRERRSEDAETRLAPWIRLDLAAGVGFEPTGDLSAASGFQDLASVAQPCALARMRDSVRDKAARATGRKVARASSSEPWAWASASAPACRSRA